MGIVPARVLLCLDTLTDVIETLNSGPRNGKAVHSSPGISDLCQLITTGKLLVYAPPTIVSAFHLFMMQAGDGLAASQCVERLLSFANCDLELDSNMILRKANAVVHQFSDADLYELGTGQLRNEC